MSDNMQSLLVKAPYNGIIKKLYAHQEELVKPGTPLLLMGVPTEFFIEVYLEPKKARYAKIIDSVLPIESYADQAQLSYLVI